MKVKYPIFLLVSVFLSKTFLHPDILSGNSRQKFQKNNFAPEDSLEILIARTSENLNIYDRIIKKDGIELFVEIIETNLFEVIFVYPLNFEKHVLSKSSIQQITWADGVVENFEHGNSKTKDLNYSQKDWRNVTVVKNESELEGLELKGEVAAFYEASTLSEGTQYLEKNAMIIARKKAARLNAHKISVITEDVKTGYGDKPKIHLVAEVYGYPD